VTPSRENDRPLSERRLPGPSRRAVIAGVPAAAALTAAAARPAAASPVPTDDYVAQGFNGLASYVLPGNDPYSAQQGRTATTPGGVAAKAADVLEVTYDQAIGVPIAPSLEINAPGAGGVVLLLDLFTRTRYFFESIGPFDHPFANLTWDRKGLVLADLDQQPVLQGTPLGYAFGTFVTLAAFASYSEGGVYNRTTRVLSGRPVGWDLSNYGGVSDGWPEFQGYWDGRTSVSDPGGA
jgi:hypothetical protein